MKIPPTIKAIAVVDKDNPKLRVIEIYNYKDDGIFCVEGLENKALVEIKFIKWIK